MTVTANVSSEKPNTLILDAPAKVNLTLTIHGRRDDGYHELESLVVFASSLTDRLRAVPCNNARVETTGPFSLGDAEENLVSKAMRATRRAAPGVKLLHVNLEKNIPPSAGLGGGSVDAAATLRALIHFNPQISRTMDWLDLAKGLGADVPVCLKNRASIMRGIGERVTTIENFPTLFALLANPMTPPLKDKTARVFARLDAANIKTRSRPRTNISPQIAFAPETAEDALRFMMNFENDLEEPALQVMPEIQGVKTAIRNSPGCQLARLTGAGPTCFGLFKTMAQANNAREHIRKNHPSWWVVATPLG